jgi:hypothetical protein
MTEALAQFTADLLNISLEETKLGLGILFSIIGLFLFYIGYISTSCEDIIK